MPRRYVVEEYGHTFIAHRENCDCLADGAVHGMSDHPIAALRSLLKQEGTL